MRRRNPVCTPVILVIASLAFSTGSPAQEKPLDESLAQAKTIYSEQGPKAALPEYEKVLTAYRNAGNRRGEAITLGLIGNCYKKLGDYPKALTLLGNALAMKREIHDRPEEGKTLSHLGLLYWEQGEYGKAIESLNESIAIARELKDVKLEAAALNNLSLVYDEQGDYRRSLEQYQHALELHRSVHYEPGESDTLGNIGGVYLSLGRYSQAEDRYQQALAISTRLNLKPSQTQDLGNIALCLLGKGQIQESIRTFDQAIPIAQQAGMAKEEADWYRGRATAVLRLGKFDDALKDYESARTTYAKAGLKRELTEVLTDTGYAYLALGDKMGAERKFQQASAESKRIGYQRGVVINQLALAEVRWRAGENMRARMHAETARDAAQKLADLSEMVSGQLLVARILLRQGRLEQAYRAADEASNIAHRNGLKLKEAEALDVLGELELRRKCPNDALEKLDQALALAAESGDVDLKWNAEYHHGQTLEFLGRDEEAVTAYKASISAIEAVRSQIGERRFRTGYFEDKQQVYLALVRLLLGLDRTGEAFTFSERLREFSYLNLQRSLPAPQGSSKIAEAAARIEHLQERIENEGTRPVAQQRSEALKVYSDELVDAQRGYAALIDSATAPPKVSAPSLDEISRALPAGSVLVEYVVDKNQLSAFVLNRAGLHATTRKIRAQDLRAKVQLLRDLIAENDGDRWRKPAASLYAMLIAPLMQKKYLAGARALFVVPDSILNYLPFAVLPVEREGRTRYLVEDFNISVLPAAALTVAQSHQPADSTGRVLAVAPARSGLAFALDEARDVSKRFLPGSDVLIGPEATETRFKERASQYQIIHLATHGFFNRANPAFSGLQLEPDAQDDGRLEVHEIRQLKLNARLVTLSACDTALGSGAFGEMPAGDEFIAVDRAFLEAGSDAVLASLWKVNDRSTLTMMSSLYSKISRAGGASALAEAQREMIRDPRFHAPLYWGAFVFVGKEFTVSQKVTERF